MAGPELEPLMKHHPVPSLPPPGAPNPAPAPSPARAGAKDVCERLPLHLRPGCTVYAWLSAKLGSKPAAARPRPVRPALDAAVGAAKRAMPAKAHESAIIHKVDEGTHVVDGVHLVFETLESAHISGLSVLNPGMATPALGVFAALGFFVKANIEMARANRDGNLAGRAHAVAMGFAKVLAAVIDQGKITPVQRRPELWPVPSTIANRFDEDYRAGVRAGLDFVAKLPPARLAELKRELEQATTNVTRQPGDSDARMLEKRAAVLLGGYDRPDLGF
jgi:hypothetical protein